MKNFILIILLLIYCNAYSTKSFSSPQIPQYTIGVETISYAPYYSLINGEYTGFIPDLFNHFAKQNNLSFVYKPLPIKRLHKQYLSGHLDFLYPDNFSWIVEQKQGVPIYYSHPVVTVIDGLMVKPEIKGKLLGSLKSLGTISGYTTPSYEALINSGQVNLVEVNQFQNLLKMVLNSRLDAAYVSINPATYQMRETFNNEQVLVFDNSLPFDHSQHCLSSIKHKKVLKQLNNFLSNNQDFIKTLKNKYGIRDY